MTRLCRAATFDFGYDFGSDFQFSTFDFATISDFARGSGKKHRRSPKWRSAAFCAPKPGRPERCSAAEARNGLQYGAAMGIPERRERAI